MRDAYMPTISELHAFVSCARTGSTTRAADELHLTQSAVSRSLGTLEERLGVLLFHRVKQRLVLSDAGHAFRREAERILGDLNQAAVAVMAFGGHSEVLRLAVLPTFASRWLVPRLRQFRDLMPKVSFDIVSRLDAIDFDNEPFDAAIQRSDLRPSNAELLPLMEERLVVVVAPELLAGKGELSDAELGRLPLLQQTTRPTLWLDWFRDVGNDPRSILRGPRFEHFDMVINAAVSGLGVALVPEVLVEPEMAAARLVPASSRRLIVSEPYSLIYPSRSMDVVGFAAFRQWLDGLVRSET
ncbi:LysR substrate-binding domain-containing protein [Mesorhizobium sp. CAU 1741]|uniref:LysR substrate-binding domain-containing protein n=1 Tax=Mesorhizobium sp. CAU 1741 TaxID=3140366 RepID=UPI00325BBBC9